MRIKIWGARGSTPTPIGPHEVKEKIISALLKIAEIKDDGLREDLLAAILAKNAPATESNGQSETLVNDFASGERRRIIETYLDKLTPLGGKTASGNTSCIEIQSGKDLFVIDAGSGIRLLGNELMKGEFGRGEGTLHLFFSHPHWDHIQGFPFFRPAYVPGNKLFIYSGHDIETALRRQQEFISFPVPLERMQAAMEFVHLEPGRVLEFNELYVRMIRNHHPGDAYAFRFEKGNRAFVYASDAAYPTGIDLDQYVEFFNEADVLLFDSQFTQRESDEKEDWGHSSSFLGVEMAHRANIKELILYHYDPNYTDSDLEKILEDTLKFQKNQYPPHKKIKIAIAEEGQVFDLLPAPTTQLKQIPGGKVAILKPAGIFDENIAAELTNQLAKLKRRSWPPQLVVDLSAVEMLQVAGLKALVKLRREQQGTPMVLAGPSINVQQLIELAGYSDFFAIYPSIHAALNALKAHETLNLPGQTIKGRYYIEAKIGDGRLGTVFQASDTRHNKTVALKILSASFSEGAIEQFLNQARQIINLTHANVVSIYDCDEDRGLSFMVEEFIQGQTLRDLIDDRRGGPLPLADALSIAEKIASGLEYAHSHGVIHGDLKPKNVLLYDDQVKISDFGLGRLESGKSLLSIDIPLAMVSARYIAPEQILGHPIDARTDLYALGAILYELFTGQPVFEGSDEEVLKHQRHTPPQPPRQINPQLSYSLEHLILKLLDKDPNKRYVEARQVRRILSSMVTFAHGALPRCRWPAYVENGEALALLTGLWTKTTQGHGQVVFVTGPAGVGKTRLIHEFTQRIEDVTLLIGKCQQVKSPYQPFAGAINTYFSNTPPETARRQVGLVLRKMGQFIPEIYRIIPEDISPDHKAPPRSGQKPNDHPGDTKNLTDQTRSMSLAKVIREATQEKPWLIIIDDLHRADRGTLHLLHYLARRCQELPLMIVGVYQDSQAANNEPLKETIASLQTTTPATVFALENLSQNGVKQFLENLWLQPAPADLVMAIYRRTKGNPFYVEEVAKGLVDDGVVSWRDNRWRFAPIVEVGLPKDVQESLRRRINRLNKQTQTLLQRAAILGQTFQFDALYEMSDFSRWDVLESLDIALERQLIKEIPGEGRLRFKHIEGQQVLYHNLSQLKRQLMHREAGEALERQYSSDDDRHWVVEALAHHFYEAGELRKSLAYSRQAAAKAEALSTAETALRWYIQAIDILDQMPEDQIAQTERFELLLAREKIYHDLGHRQGQITDLMNLQELAQASDDPVKQATVHHRRARYEQLTNQLTEALTEAQAGLIAARQVNHPRLEAENLIRLAAINVEQSNFEAALEYVPLIQKIMPTLADQSPAAALNNLLGTIHLRHNAYEQAETHYQEALAINRSIDNWQGQADSLNHLSTVCLTGGQYLEAEAFCRHSLEINRALGRRYGEAECLHNLARIHKELGYYHLARPHFEQALLLRYALEDHRGEAEDLRELGVIDRFTEDYAAAQRKLEQALDIFRRLELRDQEAITCLEVGILCEILADLPRARQAYEQARAIHHSLDNVRGEFEAGGGLAHCLLAENQAEAAQTRLANYGIWLESQDMLGGLRDPVRLYMTIYRVLRANKKASEAKKALEIAQHLAQQRANYIDDLEAKGSALQPVVEAVGQ